MSTHRLGASGPADDSRRWLRVPETVSEWLAATVAVVAASLLGGLAVGWPKVGVSVGILLGGIGLIVTVDRLWRRLDEASYPL